MLKQPQVTAAQPSWLRRVGVAFVILTGCLPAAFVLTILTKPFWEWFERAFRIEAVGHSGPAEWCYLVSYAVLIAGCTAVWIAARRSFSAPD